jgi:hypothetical protein
MGDTGEVESHSEDGTLKTYLTIGDNVAREAAALDDTPGGSRRVGKQSARAKVVEHVLEVDKELCKGRAKTRREAQCLACNVHARALQVRRRQRQLQQWGKTIA